MGAHVAGLREGLIAIGMRADIGFAASVVIEMRLQVMLLGEGLGAEGTAEGLDAGVQAMMERHVAAIRKGLATYRALIRLLAAMRPHVLLEEHLAGESLATLGTLVRLDARMDAHVHVEGDALIERLGAVGTLVLLAIAMNLHVAAQVTLVVERLAALRALRGKLLGAPMHRQVIFVVAQLRESLPTVGALVTRRFVCLLVGL